MAEEELTNQMRLASARVDEEVLAQERAGRETELELARIESGRLTEIERLRARDVTDRRQRIGLALAWLAIVTVILTIIMAIWTAADRDRSKDLRRDQLRQQTARECIRAGGVWLDGQGCLITPQGAPAPAAS